MQIDNYHGTSAITVFPGVHLHLSPDSEMDYLEMRAAQLNAINHLLTSGDFEGWDDTIKADAKWLAATLAAEVTQVVGLVARDIDKKLTEQKV